MDNDGFVGLVLGTFLGMCIGLLIGCPLTCASMKSEAIEAGVAHYNMTSGVFEWGPPVAEEP
jgi:hypothetical protein